MISSRSTACTPGNSAAASVLPVGTLARMYPSCVVAIADRAAERLHAAHDLLGGAAFGGDQQRDRALTIGDSGGELLTIELGEATPWGLLGVHRMVHHQRYCDH